MSGKAIGYLRVSSKSQATKGVSLKEQKVRIEAWAAGVHKDLTIFRDAGVSGYKEDRPGLTAALDAVEPGDTLVVYEVSRLSRRTIHHLLVLEDLHRRGVAVHSIVGGPVDMDTASGKFKSGIDALVAQQYRDYISERTKAALGFKKARHEVYTGIAPFGWTRKGKKLIANALQQRVIAIIKRLHARGRSLRGVAQRLNAHGLTASQGGRWQAQQIKNVLVYQP